MVLFPWRHHRRKLLLLIMRSFAQCGSIQENNTTFYDDNKKNVEF